MRGRNARASVTPSDGADARRTTVVGANGRLTPHEGWCEERIGCRAAPWGLRLAIRFLAGALRRAIKRLQRTVVYASKLARPPAAALQPR